MLAPVVGLSSKCPWSKYEIEPELMVMINEAFMYLGCFIIGL